jgi:hypothetical protein
LRLGREDEHYRDKHLDPNHDNAEPYLDGHEHSCLDSDGSPGDKHYRDKHGDPNHDHAK